MSISQEYIRGLKSVAVEEVFDLVLYRPLAFLFVKGIYRTPVTPNQLTIVAMVLGVIGGICYALGTPATYAAGGALCLLYNVVDCSDGQLARMKKNGTPFGRILDGAADYIVSISIYAGIGIGFASSSANPVLYWTLTVAAGFSAALLSAWLDFYRNRYLDITLRRVSVLEKEQQAFTDAYHDLLGQPGRTLEKGLIGIYLKYSSIQRMTIGGNRESRKTPSVDPATFARENRVIMHFWTYIGQTTQWTVLIISSFFNRLDIFLWWMVAIATILAAVLFIIQRAKDKKFHLMEAA
jgi:CDP-alcohol phosphatidyltransferase